MTVKFYTDSHIARRIVEQTRNQGVDIVHCAELAKENDQDAEHLAYATAQGRTMISADEDFNVLHTAYQREGK